MKPLYKTFHLLFQILKRDEREVKDKDDMYVTVSILIGTTFSSELVSSLFRLNSIIFSWDFLHLYSLLADIILFTKQTSYHPFIRYAIYNSLFLSVFYHSLNISLAQPLVFISYPFPKVYLRHFILLLIFFYTSQL